MWIFQVLLNSYLTTIASATV